MDLVSRRRQLQYLAEFRGAFGLGLQQLDTPKVDRFCLQYKSDILLVLGHYVPYTGNNTLEVYAQCRVVYMRTRMSFFSPVRRPLSHRSRQWRPMPRNSRISSPFPLFTPHMSLLDLPSEILNKCLQPLKFFDLMQVRATCRRLAKAVKEIDHGRDWEYLSAEKTVKQRLFRYQKHFDRLHFGNAHLFALDHVAWYAAFFQADSKLSCTPIADIFMHDLDSVDRRRLVGSVTLSRWQWGSEWYVGIKHLKVKIDIPMRLSEFLLMTPCVQVYEFHGSSFRDDSEEDYFTLSEREGPLCFRKLSLSSERIPRLGHIMLTIHTLFLCIHGSPLDSIVRSFPNVTHLQCMLDMHTCLHSAHPSLTKVTFFGDKNVRRPKSRRLRFLFPNATVVI